MKNIIANASRKPPVKSIKNRNLKKDLLYQSMFNFTYAGKCEIFIQTRYDKFEVVARGIHFLDDIFVFTPNYFKRWSFETLYLAILAFNSMIKKVTESMDWYKPELFQSKEVYEEITIE